jgi:hypothetical protein
MITSLGMTQQRTVSIPREKINYSWGQEHCWSGVKQTHNTSCDSLLVVVDWLVYNQKTQVNSDKKGGMMTRRKRPLDFLNMSEDKEKVVVSF